MRIVSGGQTGVDRAALDAAILAGFPVGGWCPRGRLAEDGSVPCNYPLRETPSADYAERTRWNVRDSSGTLILHSGPIMGGTALTKDLATEYGRPCLCVDFGGQISLAKVSDWLGKHRIQTLNVAGPRESSNPGIYSLAYRLLLELLNYQLSRR